MPQSPTAELFEEYSSRFHANGRSQGTDEERERCLAILAHARRSGLAIDHAIVAIEAGDAAPAAPAASSARGDSSLQESRILDAVRGRAPIAKGGRDLGDEIADRMDALRGKKAS